MTSPQETQYHDRMRLRVAVGQARRLYPGPVGEVLAKELDSWIEFGYRFGNASLINRLVDHLQRMTDGKDKDNNSHGGGT